MPELGVFPSLDMVMGTNRYGYVAGDPVNRVDPSGQFGIDLNRPNVRIVPKFVTPGTTKPLTKPPMTQIQNAIVPGRTGGPQQPDPKPYPVKPPINPNTQGRRGGPQIPDSYPVTVTAKPRGPVSTSPHKGLQQLERDCSCYSRDEFIYLGNPASPFDVPTSKYEACIQGALTECCPTNAIFGCSLNTNIPIKAQIIGIRPNHFAVDLVPEDVHDLATNQNWNRSRPQIVYAVTGGKVMALGNGNYRIQTEQIINGVIQKICYDYLHLSPIAGSPINGAIITAGQPLGQIEDWQADEMRPIDANKGPSHVHVAIFPCDDNMYKSGNQLDPTSTMDYLIPYTGS